ncbi:MAG: hypothetical protein ABIT09_04930 [Croceibacterium sp.]
MRAAGDRFAQLPRAAALAVLAAFAVLLATASLTYPVHLKGNGFATTVPRTSKAPRDHDLALYAAIAARVGRGENYYRSAVIEQRAGGFPVTPGLAVRLPTFAFLTVWLGRSGIQALGALLALACALAWWRRLGAEPGGRGVRLAAVPLMLATAGYATSPHYFMLHEVWAGAFMTLALGLHRPGRWWWAWLAAAAALAIRELALPLVMLLGAMALWRRDSREAAAWALLVALYAVVLAWHLHQIAPLVEPTDKPSPPWLVFRGLPGWTVNLVLSSHLAKLPNWLAAMVVCVPLIGWAGWRSPAGLTGFLLHAGYLVLFMAAGRDNNFYWGLLLAPSLALGLAFAPRALLSLGRAALGKP